MSSPFRLVVLGTMCALVLFSAGCSLVHRPPSGFRAVWTPKDGTWPPAVFSTPEGFRVTPRQAYEITHKGRHRSLKHVWHLYADDRYYYVHDTFLEDAPRQVYKQGLRIDGQTGRVAH